MDSKPYRVDKVAALCAIIWFACIIDACFTWFMPWGARLVLSAPFVFWATHLLHIKGKIVINRRKQLIILYVFVLTFFILVTKFTVLPLLTFLPFACILTWNDGAILQFYRYLKAFVVFYAIVSICVEFLVLSNVWYKLPSITLPAQDNVQENLDVINHFYGLFVIPESPSGVTFYRAMGPLREGGHFSIFIGFIYFVESIVWGRRNVWLLIAGFFTLSPNFLFFFLLTEAYSAVIKKKIMISILFVLCLLSTLVFSFFFAPDSIKDEIVRIVLERSLEQNLENAESEGFFALLDGRSNTSGLQLYDNFSKRGTIMMKLVGTSLLPDDFVLSDFRYLICHYGYIGFFFFMLITIKLAFVGKNKYYALCLLLLAFFVMLSRAWMYDQMYIWTMIFLAVSINTLNDVNKIVAR